jgi:hypothetical protein
MPSRLMGAAIVACLITGNAVAGTLTPQATMRPAVTPAADGIFAAFKTHPLVGLGDYHALSQEQDFYAAIIRDPRFAREVGNVVVEFGGAAHQDIVDKYVAGEDVPYLELRKVWTDVVGWLPTVTSLGLIDFYAQVRTVNLALPKDQRIHVWLGEPSIDWSKIKTRDDFHPILGLREKHAADVIENEILGKNRRALVIYGGLHFGAGMEDTLKDLVEHDHPNAFFTVLPYTGFVEKSCSLRFERNARDWPPPALATPVRETSLEKELRPRNCHNEPPITLNFGPGVSQAEFARATARTEAVRAGTAGDALLYLGPARSLARAPIAPDIYLDPEYRAEIARRFELMTGNPLQLTVESNPMTLRPLRPSQ